MDNSKKLEAVLNQVLQISGQTISDDLTPDQVEAWDSVSALLLVSELEKAFQIQLSVQDVQSMKSIGLIKTALKKHGVEI